MKANYYHEPMPVITTASGMLAFASILPIFAAASTIATPNQIEGFTLTGALVAMFLALCYLRIKAPQLGNNISNLGFTCLSTVSVGWILPEPLAWWLVRIGWFHAETVADFPRKMWALGGLGCGLCGSTLILFAIHWAQSRLPKLLEEKVTLATVRTSPDSEIRIERARLPKAGESDSPETDPPP